MAKHRGETLHGETRRGVAQNCVGGSSEVTSVDGLDDAVPTMLLDDLDPYGKFFHKVAELEAAIALTF